MMTCPVCHHEEYEGELFCSRCGAQLTLADESPITKNFTNTQMMDTHAAPTAIEPHPSAPPQPPAPGQIALAVEGTPASLILAGKFEYFLGREGQGQPPPDVDLTPFGGREKGVSRRHASLRVDGKQLLLMDLHSANGTKLNGEPLLPQEPVRLLDGDEIWLGKLSMHIYFNL
jgi:hypothetical protein